MSTDTRRSPIAELLPSAPAGAGATLSHPTDLIKVGARGPGLAGWAATRGINVPEEIYGTLPVGASGLLARVGSGEIILETAPDTDELGVLERALQESADGIAPVSQQTATFELSGPRAPEILAQTCGVNFQRSPPGRIVFTRIAGVSGGVIPLAREGATVFRIWVDYTLAPYLWETLVEIREETLAAG